MLRFAYSTINWGETPDLEETFAEIRDAGWDAVELFWHSLDWLGPMPQLLKQLGDLQVATLFGAVSVPTDRTQLTKLKNHVDYAAELGAEASIWLSRSAMDACRKAGLPSVRGSALLIFHLSCAKTPSDCDLLKLPPRPGTRMLKRSGYVRGSAGSNGPLLRLNENVPFGLLFVSLLYLGFFALSPGFFVLLFFLCAALKFPNKFCNN